MTRKGSQVRVLYGPLKESLVRSYVRPMEARKLNRAPRVDRDPNETLRRCGYRAWSPVISPESSQSRSAACVSIA
jgi:hypothetical protein